MKTPPADLEGEQIANALLLHWGVEAVALTYLPLGFGSHHWVADAADDAKWFVTIDDLRSHHLAENPDAAFEALTIALQAAAALRDTGNLRFVVGPIFNGSGGCVVRIDQHYAMAVYPHLDVKPSDFGEFRTLTDQDDAMRLIGAVHNATPILPLDGLRRDTLEIPDRAGLIQALSTLDNEWDSGPYAARAQAFLRDHRELVIRKLARFDGLVRSAGGNPSAWVVTHGEPHAGNVIRTATDDLVVVDWDTVALAPRERDLWMMVGNVNPDWSAYRDSTGVSIISEVALDAYRLHWDLEEIGIYVKWLRQPHGQTEEMEIAWSSLEQYVRN